MRTITKHVPLTYVGKLNGQKFLIIDDGVNKRFVSEKYNYILSRENGQFARWGKTQQDDPDYSPFGPEILDFEISEGKCGGGCAFCYKANSPILESKHTTLDEFCRVLDKISIGVRVYVNHGTYVQYYDFPANEMVMTDSGVVLACHLYEGMLCKGGEIVKVDKFTALTQIALGLTDTASNPDIWRIIDEGNRRGIVMNLTTHGMDINDETADNLANKCGAVAVSVKKWNKDKAYEAIQKLTDRGMEQINVHFVLGMESVEFAKQIMQDIKSDKRLAKLNAVVFLSFKDKANTGVLTPITIAAYKDLVGYCEQAGINFGFDSCAGFNYLKAVQDKPNYKELQQCVDTCCSTCFSSYINCSLNFTPCSFTEGDIPEFGDGISVDKCNNFVLDVWESQVVKQWRQHNLDCKKICKNPCKYNFE